MSSQRVIQDSDDEGDDILSDVASSCDPLQDSTFAPTVSEVDVERVDGNQSALLPLSSNDNLPQVDFDRFLRSESSIMAGDYEDERWVSTANSNPANDGLQIRANNTFQDRSFPYTVNAHRSISSELPPTSNGGYDDAGTEEPEHPSKRRRVTYTQDSLVLQESREYTDIGLSDLKDTSQIVHSPGPLPALNDTRVIGDQAPFTGSPPPTIPFSEDPEVQEKEEPLENANLAQNDMQGAAPPQSGFETDNEITNTKKKRGRPKKQETAETTNNGLNLASEDSPEMTELLTKKKPGRPKKQEADTTACENYTINNTSADGVQDVMDQEKPRTDTSTASKKKKVKRSKTTSDLPSTKASELSAEADVVWIETNSLHSADPEKQSSDATAKEGAKAPAQCPTEDIEVPKKRGRKKKSTLEAPVSTSTENHTVLQDISNLHNPPPQQNKQISIEVEIDKEKYLATGGESPKKSHPAEPIPSHDLSRDSTAQTQSKEVEEEIKTPIPQEKVASLKQTPLSGPGKVPYRVGLSRRARIAPLLKVVRK